MQIMSASDRADEAAARCCRVLVCSSCMLCMYIVSALGCKIQGAYGVLQGPADRRRENVTRMGHSRIVGHLEGHLAAAMAGCHVHVDHERLGLCRQRDREVLRGQAQRAGRALPRAPARCGRLLRLVRQVAAHDARRDAHEPVQGGDLQQRWRDRKLQDTRKTPRARMYSQRVSDVSALQLMPAACSRLAQLLSAALQCCWCREAWYFSQHDVPPV